MVKVWPGSFLGWPAGQPAVPTALQRPSAPLHSYGVTPAVVFTMPHPQNKSLYSYYFIFISWLRDLQPFSPLAPSL